MPRQAITILSDGHLNVDFLNGCALPNAREVLKAIAPGVGVRGRSIDSLIERIPEEGLPVSPEEFREAVWELMREGYKGNHHISLIAEGPLLEADPVVKLSEAWRRWSFMAQNTMTIQTRQVLDARIDEGTNALQLLYVGQAEADVYDEKESYDQEINGREYVFKAYRVVDVPVFTRVDIPIDGPFITVTTRAVHQKVRPISEIEGVREVLRAGLQVEVPPLGGVGHGVRNLWGRKITPRKFEVHEADGARVNFSCAPGAKNPGSESVEAQLLLWEFKNGALLFDDETVHAPFLVDAGRAAFSFGSKVTREQADHVISEILAAAP